MTTTRIWVRSVAGGPFVGGLLRETVEDRGVGPERVPEAAVEDDLARRDEGGKRLLRPLGEAGGGEGENRKEGPKGRAKGAQSPSVYRDAGPSAGQARTASSWSTAQSISSRVMTSGGARRIVWTWVSLQSIPRSLSW